MTRWTIGFLAAAVAAGVVGFGGVATDRTVVVAAQGVCVFAVLLSIVSVLTDSRLSA